MKEQLEAGIRPTSQEGIDQVDQLSAIRERVEELVTLQAAVFTKDVAPALQEAGVEFCDWSDLDETRGPSSRVSSRTGSSRCSPRSP